MSSLCFWNQILIEEKVAKSTADVGELPAWCFSSRLRRRTAGAAPLCHLTVDRQSALERLGNGPTPPRDLLHARWPV